MRNLPSGKDPDVECLISLCIPKSRPETYGREPFVVHLFRINDDRAAPRGKKGLPDPIGLSAPRATQDHHVLTGFEPEFARFTHVSYTWEGDVEHKNDPAGLE